MIIKEWDNLIVTDNVLTNLPISQLSSIPMNANGVGPEDLMLLSKPCEPSAMTDTGYMSYKAKMADVSSFAYSALGISDITSDIFGLKLSTGTLMPFYDMLMEISNACPSAVVDIEDQYGKFNPYVISAIYTKEGTILSDLGGYRFADAMSNIFDWKKFGSISARAGYFDNLSCGNLTAAVNAYINSLTAARESITNLTAANAYISGLLTAKNAHISDLTAINANISNLTANNANIHNLTATTLCVDGHPYYHLSVMRESAYQRTNPKSLSCFYFTYP